VILFGDVVFVLGDCGLHGLAAYNSTTVPPTNRKSYLASQMVMVKWYHRRAALSEILSWYPLTSALGDVAITRIRVQFLMAFHTGRRRTTADGRPTSYRECDMIA